MHSVTEDMAGQCMVCVVGAVAVFRRVVVFS